MLANQGQRRRHLGQLVELARGERMPDHRSQQQLAGVRGIMRHESLAPRRELELYAEMLQHPSLAFFHGFKVKARER